MEKLQVPINSCLISEELEVGNWLEEFISSTTGNFKFEDPYNTDGGAYYVDSPHYTLPSLEHKMPFLQMLQSVEASQHQQQPLSSSTTATFPLMQLEPNFQFLLRLQHQKITCFTNPEISDNHNDILINSNNDNNNNHNNNNNGMIIMDLHSAGVKSGSEVQQIAAEVEPQKRCKKNNNHLLKSSTSSSSQREKRKRKRSTRPAKNKEEVETQRMTHIAVERNRRRQMNEHLNALRALMPPSYVQRGDQASIIGGAIDFVKELEQMLQSLQAQKKMRQCEENGDVSGSNNSSTSSSSNLYSSNIFMDSSPFHQLRNQVHSQEEGNGNGNGDLGEGIAFGRKSNEEYSAEKKSALADIEVVVIQNHVNLKIQCQRRPGQLLKAIVAFEELRLTVLHLNITSLHTLVHYSFNLKIEDDCELGSADDVARAVHQIFSFINLN